MKTFNFRKLGILLVMMLVSGMILVGSASAANPVYTANYKLTAGGNVNGNTVSFLSYVKTINGEYAEHISASAVLEDRYGNYIDHASNDDGWDVKALVASGSCTTTDQHHVDASFSAIEPTDSYYYATYYY